MVSTFRLMSQIRQEQYKQLTNEQLVEEYKATTNQSMLAELFCKNFAYISRVVFQPVYSYIDNEDKISAVLSGIYNAASKFEPKRGYVFNTFMIQCIKGELNMQIAYLSYKKRKSNGVCSLDGMYEDMDGEAFEKNIIKPYDDSYDTIELINSIDNSNLSQDEKIMCKAIIQDSNITNLELADLLSCHRHTVRSIKNSLKNKLAVVM